MRFTTARLCGGEALMAISADILDLDIEHIADILQKDGCPIKEKDEMMIVTEWNGMDTTIYPQGKIMFFPLKDKSLCIKYATDLLVRFSE